MANTTNYNWETPDDTDLVKDGAAAIRTLGSSIDTTTKNLNPQTTTGALAYRSATANVNTALPIGTANQVLRVNSGGTAPEWATTADQTPLTTKGDLFGFDTADARIPVGTNGHILTADSNESLGLKWAAPAGGSTFVGCALVKNATQSTSNGTETALTFATETYDTDGFHDNSSNTSRITIPAGKGGKYLFTGVYAFADNTTGIRYLNLKTNGSASLYLNNANATSSSSGFYCFSFVLSLVATDYVEMFVYQSSGGSLNASTDCRFQASYLGA